MPRYAQAILVSCQVPWDEREQLIEDVFRAEVQLLRQHGFQHMYIFGTAGEGYAVDTARFTQVVELFRETTHGTDSQPQVGVIGLSTATVVERLAIAYAAGFRTFQISLPSWGALNDLELLRFFSDVCGAFPDAQFLHYNLPRAKRVLNGADYRRIADVVPNLAATKNTAGGAQRAADLMRHAPDLQHFFSEDNFLHGAMFGECSILASFSTIVPRKLWRYFQAGRDRDPAALLALHHELLNLFYDVLGPAIAHERIDGAYDKLLVRLAGLETMPLRLLSPYQTLDEEVYRTCAQIFRERYADWSA